MNLDNKIIICPNNVGKVFLNLRRKDPTSNFTMFDLKSLQRLIFGDYTKETVNYLLQHTDYHLKDIQTELGYISRGINVDNSTAEIKDIYKIVKEKELLEYDDLVKELFKQNDVIVIGYNKNNLELLHLLEVLEKEATFIKLNEVVPQTTPKLLQFKTIDEEIRYVFNVILHEDNLKLRNGESLNKKCIICNTQEYSAYLKMYADKYGVKLYFKNDDCIKNTNIGKEVLERAKDTSLSDPFEFLDDLHTPITYGGLDLIEPIKEIINDYLVCKDGNGKPMKDENNHPIYVDKLYENLSILLESKKIDEPHYKNEIIVSSQPDFNPNIEYYVLGASDSFLPTLSKNNELLDDSVLRRLGLNPSSIKNIETEEISEAFVNASFVKHISYYQTKGKDNVFHTTFIPDDKDDVKPEDRRIIKPTKLDFDYSKAVATAYLSKALDIKQKYKEETPDLAYATSIGEIINYDSSFDGIKQNEPDRKLYFAYSSLEQLYECPFKYYITHVMHMDEFKNNYGAKLGEFAHKIFENIGIDSFDVAWNKAVNDYNMEVFTAKEKMLLHADKEILRITYNNLKNRFYTSGVAKTYLHEYRNTYEVVPNEVYITGSIDNFIITPDDKIVIFDYKTGSYNKGNQKCYDNGLSLQLFIYSYMLSKDSKYASEEITGIYYCPVLPTQLNRQSKEFSDNSKLQGMTYNVSPIPNGKEFIVSFKNPGADSIPLKNQLENVESKIINANELVRASKFTVSPTYVKKDTCKFCAFKDICFKSKAFNDRPNIIEEEKMDAKNQEGGEENE